MARDTRSGPVFLVFGNRKWSCRDTIYAWLLPIQSAWIRVGACAENAPVMIHGAAEGADRIADDVALELGFIRKPYPITRADWDRHGAAAGYIRNRRMAEDGKPDFGIGFGYVQKVPRKVDRTGSGHMLDILNELGIRVQMIARPGDMPGWFK